MKVFWLKSDISLPPETYGGNLVIGNFDGIHKGHLLLLEKAKEMSLNSGNPFNVLTFYPHPYFLFYPEKKSFSITPLRSKLRILRDFGVDNVFLCKFTHRVASLTAKEYVDIFFKKIVKPNHIIIGDDHAFGKGRTGNADFLRAEGFNVDVVKRDLRYSSSYIRELIEDGEMMEVYKCLGRFYEIEDFVHKGKQNCKKTCFPTANLHIRTYVKPRYGVYATKTLIDNEWKNGISYFGFGPTLQNEEPILQNYIFNVNCNLYGKRIRVIFIDYIRNEIRFKSGEEIKLQLKNDILKAKGIL